ncbi:MAG: methylmalonyl-CoA mutase family protein [Dehalococcoidia bacterium]|nr:methylmalonyl-CoA mutase family protein [Dehalococcoidia bacterium]MDW8008038.1 methylmalonyl-CoA mutase family protein [Chloroflexota bacterium]
MPQGEEELEELKRERREWEEWVEREWPERADDGFTTVSGRPVRRLYDPTDLAGLDYRRDIGLPGRYPYTRGIYPTGYRGKVWTMRQFSGFGLAEETNARFKFLLAEGQTGLSIAFDLPTLYGYDTDHPMAEGEFGKCGVAVSSLRDMEILLDGIPLGEISTSMTINSPAAVIWAMYIAVADRQGVPRERLRGTIQNDILKEYIAQKEFLFPPEPSMRLVVDTVEFCVQQVPKWHPISISGYHIREAGATAAQELAFTLADGFEYVRWCLERGLDVDQFAPTFSFFFNCHNDFFEEVAKFRAARRIWARQMREVFGAKDPRSWWLRFHTQTAGCSLTAQQPEVNLIRTTIQALAAVLGGTQSLHTNSWDEALALPSEKAARLALRVQQVIAHESGVTNSVDPLGGSYLVEALTQELEEEARAYFRRIEDLGGVIPAIRMGFFQREIAEASYRYQREVDEGRRVVVGVNRYVLDEPIEIPILRVDPTGEGYRRQVERLRELRRERDNREVVRCLRRLEQACRGQENVMPHLIEAVKAYCTLGEICDVMREVFGVYQEEAIY